MGKTIPDGPLMGATRTLATFAVTHKTVALPQNVRHEAARALLNWLGCAIGASRHETIRREIGRAHV